MTRLICDFCKKEMPDTKDAAVVGFFFEGPIHDGGPSVNGLPLAAKRIVHRSCAEFLLRAVDKPQR